MQSSLVHAILQTLASYIGTSSLATGVSVVSSTVCDPSALTVVVFVTTVPSACSTFSTVTVPGTGPAAAAVACGNTSPPLSPSASSPRAAQKSNEASTYAKRAPIAKPPPVEKEQLVLTVQTSELLIRNMQPTRAAWMRARTDKAIRMGLMERHPQQKPHQLNTMQQNAMKAAMPVVILVILIRTKEKVECILCGIKSIYFHVSHGYRPLNRHQLTERRSSCCPPSKRSSR